MQGPVEDDRGVQVLPFIAVAALGLLSVALPPYGGSAPRQALAGAAAALTTALLAWWTVRLPPGSRFVHVPPLLFLGVLALAGYAAGGESSGLAPLILLPVLWLVLHAGRRELYLCAAGAGAVLLAPFLLVGAPRYDAGEWRRAVLWALVIGVLCPSVQAAVQALRRAVEQERLTRQELVAAAERWRALIELLPGTSVLVVDRDLRYQVALGSEMGVAPDLVGRTLFETSGPENARVLEGLYRAALDGRPGSAELAATYSGNVLAVSVLPLTSHAGDPEALVVTYDVTALRRGEAALRAARDRSARLFSEAPHATLLVSRDGVTDANPALGALVDLPEQQVVGTALRDLEFLPRETRAQLAAMFDGGGARLSVESPLTTATGESRDTTLTAVVLFDEQGGRESLLVTLVDVSERRRYEQRLADLADQDPLTGLANRRKFDEELTGHLERCRRYGALGAVFLLDLDQFKQVNDTLGHHVGDQLIGAVAGVLRHRTRTADVVARLGGDEFAVLLPHVDRAGAERVARDLVELVREVQVEVAGRARHVTVSIGVVLVSDPDMTPGELVSTADMVMYDAKEAGRDRYLVHDTTVHPLPRSGARMAWLDRISHALEDGRFAVHAQPVLDLRSGRVTGAELLVRMVDEQGGLVPPGRFLYIAERTDLIRDIDMMMVRRAVELLEQVQAVDPGFSLEVNLSGHSVGSERLARHITSLLATHRVDPSGLVFEITETAAVADIATARAFAEEINGLGSRFALDDFGAGFGSFYYLKHLLFDFIKIDGEFVAGSPADPSDRLILASIVGIAKGMGKQTIAEYVTDAAVLDVVRELGVDHAQGFHVGRPAPVEDLLTFLHTRAASSPLPSPS